MNGLILCFSQLHAQNVIHVKINKRIDKSDSINQTQIISDIILTPEFPGGDTAYETYLKNNLIYPKAALKARIEGEVFVKFTVDSMGNVLNCKVLKGIGYGCDEEALRLFRSMPTWKPAESEGNPVTTNCSARITFTLPE
jgi:TonB family protein